MLEKKRIFMEKQASMQDRKPKQMTHRKLMLKLTDVLLQEKLIAPDEKAKLLKILKNGETP